MRTESHRIADQLRRVYSGDPWHGDPLSRILADITDAEAHARPLPSAHNIWELVLHIDTWTEAALEAINGVPIPRLYGTEKDWPRAPESSGVAWADARQQLMQTGERLAQAIETFEDERLPETVPGRPYDFYYLFHGIVQHGAYHGGQIALLAKARAKPKI
jgi:hypothetical protein